jgi:L-fuconolactonase
MTVVDAHQHFWDLSAHDQPWLSSQPELAPLLRDFAPADLAPAAAAAGVSATVVVQTITEPGETPDLLALAADSDLVAAVVGWTDLTALEVTDALAALRELPGAGRLAGIRHPVLIEPDPAWLARPDVLRGLAAVAGAGLVFDIVGTPAQLPAAGTAARATPELVFVLDHLGNPDVTDPVDERWSAVLRELAALPNTVCKLSGILSEPPPQEPGGSRAGTGAGTAGPGEPAPASVAHLRPCYQIALDAFGPGRLMFGSDWPVSTLGAPYQQVLAAARALTADLSEAERDAVFAGTARRVYRITDPA